MERWNRLVGGTHVSDSNHHSDHGRAVRMSSLGGRTDGRNASWLSAHGRRVGGRSPVLWRHGSVSSAGRYALARGAGLFRSGHAVPGAFNHDEATRSFAQATLADPDCAMCYWGVALSLGPNYNMPVMADIRAQVGWQAIGQAQRLAPKASPVDQALIAALAQRFDGARGATLAMARRCSRPMQMRCGRSRMPIPPMSMCR